MAEPSSIVRSEDGTISPSNISLGRKRSVAHTLIDSLVADVARLSKTNFLPYQFASSVQAECKQKPHVSPAQALRAQPSWSTGHGYIDPALKRLARRESDDSKSNTIQTSLAAAPIAVARTDTQSQQKCHLLRIPAEIRLLIYDLVLVSKDSIANAHKLLDSDDSIDATDHDARIDGIDSRLLRTCRAVHQEAVRVLYGRNTFYFSNQDHIEAFKGTSYLQSQTWSQTSQTTLSGTSLSSEKYGRLILLRKVILRLGPSDDFFSQYPSRNAKDTRNNIWRSWYKLFDRKQFYLLDFPLLETLTLDLSEWLLTGGDVLRVDRFVKKFKPADGLHRLIVKGMSNEKNLQDLKAGLVKPGGILEVIP